jgi:death-on-curing protein
LATPAAQAAAMVQSLARNHALVDGNKRIAWAATKLFLRFTGVALRAPSPEVGERFVLDVVDGSLNVREITERLASWSTPA